MYIAVGTPASLSCGSMTLGSTMEHQRGVGSHHHHLRHSSRDRAGNASPLLSPTHTVDIHDFDTRDLTIMTAGGIGTTSPSPPLTTSLSPGTSITSSPQHFYPGGRQTDDEEQEYTTAVTEQRGTPSTGGSQRQSPYRHQNTGQINYGSIQSRQFPHHTHITTSQTQTTTRIITQHPTTLPRSNTSKSKSNASNRMQQSDRISNQGFCRHDWQRSASCRNLHNDSRFEKGREEGTRVDPVRDARVYYESVYRQERLIESPITRYDDSRRACYSAAGSKTNSVDRGSDTVPDTRIYSSSYPGTTSSLSTESGGGDEPGGMMEAGSECILLTSGGMESGSQEEILYSHDDISHDSYELLEREGEEEGDDEEEDDDEERCAVRRRVKSYSGTRSCSLESGGDILPMDEDEMSRVGHDDDLAVFQMDEIETVGSQTYVKERSNESSLENVVAGLQSTNADVNERKGLECKLDDRNVMRENREIQTSLQVQSPEFDAYEHKDFDGSGVKTNSGEGSMVFTHYGHKPKSREEEYVPKHDTVETEEGFIHTVSSKQAQTHFLEYNAKCKPGLVVGFESREEVLTGGGRKVSMTHTPVERAKSDPHTGSFRIKGSSKRKRRILTHQKSIDVTPAGSGESDDEREGDESSHYAGTMAASLSEYNIPYTLHKRHAMNGTASSQENAVPHQVEMLTDDYKAQKSDRKLVVEDRHDDQFSRIVRKKAVDDKQMAQQQSSDNSGCFKMIAKVGSRSDAAEKVTEITRSAGASHDTKEISKVTISQDVSTDDAKISEAVMKLSCIVGSAQMVDHTKCESLEKFFKESSTVIPGVTPRPVTSSDDERGEKSLPAPRKSRTGPPAELPTGPLLPRKRDRSPILFARARLGLSEGSAFSPVHQVGSPASSRRTKSLDAPVVAVHRLPPADAFSSNDDTLDNGIGKSEPLKPLEIIAKRLPSTIEDENGITDVTQDSLGRPLEWEAPKQTSQQLRKHSSSNVGDTVIVDVALNTLQPDKRGLPSQSANFELSSAKAADKAAIKSYCPPLTDRQHVCDDVKEAFSSNQKEPVKSKAVQKPAADVLTEQTPSLANGVATPQTEVYVSEEHVTIKPQVPYNKPTSQKSLEINEGTVMKGKSEETAVHLHDHSVVKFITDSENEQPGETKKKEKTEESHIKIIENFKSPQVSCSEIVARQENADGVTGKDISSTVTHVAGIAVDTHQELEDTLKEIPGPENVFSVSCELDQHFSGRERNILSRDKGGSSGDYQTFDDIELPSEFRDNSDVSVHPKTVIDESSDEKKHMAQVSESHDFSFECKQIYQSTMKESTSLKLEEPECAVVPVVDQAVLLTATSGRKSECLSHPKTESKKRKTLDMKVEMPPITGEGGSLQMSGIKSDAELVSVEKQSFFVVESGTSQTPARAPQFVPVLQPESKQREADTFQTTRGATNESVVTGTRIVSAIFPGTCLSEVERESLVIPATKAKYQTSLSKGCHIPVSGTGTAKVKAHRIEIIKIESNSLEKEEAIATSDDEIPAIPLDEEGSSLERWVSVEDIHEELLAADYALKGALDLGHEFQYIDEDDRRSPDTCSDYDNLSSSSPSSHVLAQDTEPPREQAEEFVEIELDRGNFGQRNGDRNGAIAGTKMHKEVRVSCEDQATIATQESDSTVSSSAGKGHMAENVERSEEVKGTVIQVVEEDKSQIHAEISSHAITEGSIWENEFYLMVEQVDERKKSTALSKSSSDSQNLQREQNETKQSQEKEGCPGKVVDLEEQGARLLKSNKQDQQPVEDKIGLTSQHSVVVSLQLNESDRKNKMKVEEERTVDERKDNSGTHKLEQKPAMVVDLPESHKEVRDDESPESTKDDKVVAERSKSEEEASSSSSLALPVRVELSSTWRPFLLESSGSSSLEEGFFPPDEEETTSSPSNNEREEAAASIDFPTSFGYPCIGDVITSVGGYGGPGVFALSRTLSRISERSTTSEQERSDLDDDSTKLSSRSPSVDDESLLSSDHQPSLSSDPPSGGPTVDEGVHGIKPPAVSIESDTPAAGPSSGSMYIPPPLLSDDDWPSPPTSSSVFETPVVSHVETFYMEINPEEACKVLVIDSATDPAGGDGSSTDENHTLQDEDDDFLSGECLSSSATTLDGTVKVAVRPKCPSHYCAGSSLSEDTSMALSLSEWSSSTSTIRPQCPLHCPSAKGENTSLDDLRRSVPDLPTSSRTSPNRTRSPSYYSGAKSDTCLDDSSPTRLGKPSSGQKSRITFYSASKSLTSVDTSFDNVPVPIMSSERPVKVVRPKCTPYYSTAHSDEGDRMLERAVLSQGREEKDPSSQSLEAPAVWSSERNIATHSVHQITGPKVRSKCYSYYSSAAAVRSPQSDGDTSSSLDGSNVTERVARAPKRRKSQPKKRHRVTVDLKVRDGQIVEVSSTSAVETHLSGDQSHVSTQGTADSIPTVMFVPKQSSV